MAKAAVLVAGVLAYLGFVQFERGQAELELARVQTLYTTATTPDAALATGTTGAIPGYPQLPTNALAK